MSGKKVASLIAYIIFGLIAVACAVLILGGAFDAQYAISVEHYIITSWKWANFNIVLWGIIFMVVSLGIIIIMLVLQDDKANKPVRRRYN